MSNRDVAAFAQSFAAGFNTVDAAAARTKRRELLEQGMEDTRNQRNFMNQRLTTQDEIAAQDRDIRLEDRTRRQAREDEIFTRQQEMWGRQDTLFNQSQTAVKMRREGLKRYNAGEDVGTLLDYAPFSPEIQAELSRQKRFEELAAALDTASQLRAQNDPESTLQEGAAQLAAGEEPVTSFIEPSRGTTGFRSFDMSEQVRPMDVEANASQEGFFGALGARVAGTGRALSTGAANLVQSVRGEPPVASGASFAEVGGNIMLPENFTSPKELEGMNQQERAEALVTNADILEQARDLSSDPYADPVDQLREGSREQFAAARRQDFDVNKRWLDFADATTSGAADSGDNQLVAMMEEDPVAFVMQYAKDRSTLQGYAVYDDLPDNADPKPGPRGHFNTRRVVDWESKPVFDAAELQLSRELVAAEPGTADHRTKQRQLQALQMTRQEIYNDSNVPEVANIRQTMPTGNTELTNQLMSVVDDPSRPRPSPGSTTSQELRPALTTARRMAGSDGSRRLTRGQLNHLIVLNDNNLISREQLIGATMTGVLAMPQDKTEFQQFQPGPVYKVTGNGELVHVATIPDPGRTSRRDVGVNKATLESIENFQYGYRSQVPNATPEDLQALENVFYQDEDWIENTNIDLSDPIAVRQLGIAYAQARKIADAENNWLWDPLEELLGGEAPSMHDIIRSPGMAARLSLEHDIPIRMPEQRFDQALINKIREDMMSFPGMFPPGFPEASEKMTDAELFQALRTYDALVEGG